MSNEEKRFEAEQLKAAGCAITEPKICQSGGGCFGPGTPAANDPDVLVTKKGQTLCANHWAKEAATAAGEK